MKKLIAIVATFALVLCMSVTAFAAPSLPATGTNDDVTINSTPGTNDVPVYGYIGEDANITDPDPTDPDVPPTVTPTGTDMELSVPVKLMWAAFASNGGTVTSPTYTIENKSAFAVDVELTSFAQTSAANATKDAQITLSLTGLNAGATNVVGMAAPLSAGTLSKATALGGASATKTFTIGGTYTGSFNTAYAPTYSMVLTFSLA